MPFLKADTVKTDCGYKITWLGENIGKIKIYAAAKNDFLPAEDNFLTDAQGGECTVKVSFPERAYFILKAEDGAAIRTAVRLLKTEKIKNFRDIGGYLAKDGRRVKWGMLYRSAAHDVATDNDLKFVEELGIKSVVDYRTSREYTDAPDRRIDGVSYISDPPFPENAGAADVLHFDHKSEQGAIEGMLNCNYVLATAEDSFKAYHKLFEIALDDKMVPTLQHCTAGKDRVGVGVCCMLWALGVDEDTIMEDYLLSNYGKLPVEKLMGAKAAKMSEDSLKAIDALLGVRKEYLGKFLDTVKAKYGTPEAFLTKAIGLTEDEIKAFQDKYLERL